MSVRVQNARDFPQTNLDSEINAPFLLIGHGDPRLFYGYVHIMNGNYAKFQEKFDSGTISNELPYIVLEWGFRAFQPCK